MADYEKTENTMLMGASVKTDTTEKDKKADLPEAKTNGVVTKKHSTTVSASANTITKKPNDYKPGDIVSWSLSGGLTHIGIVVDKKSIDNKRNLIVHNIGSGQVIEDCLFDFKITGHYSYKN